MSASKHVSDVLSSRSLTGRNMEQGSYIDPENESQANSAQKGEMTHPTSHTNSKTQPEGEFEFPNSHSTTSKYLRDITIFIFMIFI